MVTIRFYIVHLNSLCLKLLHNFYVERRSQGGGVSGVDRRSCKEQNTFNSYFMRYPLVNTSTHSSTARALTYGSN